MIPKPNDATVKPSDTFFADLPTVGSLGVDDSLSPADMTRAVRRMAAYIDEQHAAGRDDSSSFERCDATQTVEHETWYCLNGLGHAGRHRFSERAQPSRVEGAAEAKPDGHLLCAGCGGCHTCSGSCGRPACSGLCAPVAEPLSPNDLDEFFAGPNPALVAELPSPVAGELKPVCPRCRRESCAAMLRGADVYGSIDCYSHQVEMLEAERDAAQSALEQANARVVEVEKRNEWRTREASGYLRERDTEREKLLVAESALTEATARAGAFEALNRALTFGARVALMPEVMARISEKDRRTIGEWARDLAPFIAHEPESAPVAAPPSLLPDVEETDEPAPKPGWFHDLAEVEAWAEPITGGTVEGAIDRLRNTLQAGDDSLSQVEALKATCKMLDEGRVAANERAGRLEAELATERFKDNLFPWEDANGDETGTGGLYSSDPNLCRGCGEMLLPENRRIADGCACNSRRGINHGLVPKNTCTCFWCDPKSTGGTRYPAEKLPGLECPAPVATDPLAVSTKDTLTRAVAAELPAWAEGKAPTWDVDGACSCCRWHLGEAMPNCPNCKGEGRKPVATERAVIVGSTVRPKGGSGSATVSEIYGELCTLTYVDGTRGENIPLRILDLVADSQP